MTDSMKGDVSIKKLRKIERRAREIADHSITPAAEIPNMIADLAAAIAALQEDAQ